jgi:hypothetical protein
MSVLRVSSVTAGLASILMMAMAFASSPAHASVRPQTAVHTTTLDVQGVQRDRTSLSAGPHVKIVVSGNTLSGIAEQKYGNPACWPGVYDANKKTIGSDPDVITVGERLTLPAACDTTPPVEVTAVVKKTVPVHSGATETVSAARSGSFYADVLTRSQVEALWEDEGGPAGDAVEAADIAYCESGWNRFAYNPSGATGIWQILGAVAPGNLTDPYVNARNAVVKFDNAGHSFAPWVCKA